MAVSKSNIKAICDAGPIIHLDELNCLDLLCDFQEIVLGDTVREEVKHHRPGALKKPIIHFRGFCHYRKKSWGAVFYR